jgi:hypothetical protein
MIKMFEKLDAMGVEGLIRAQFVFALLFFVVTSLYVLYEYRKKAQSETVSGLMKFKKWCRARMWWKKSTSHGEELIADELR